MIIDFSRSKLRSRRCEDGKSACRPRGGALVAMDFPLWGPLFASCYTILEDSEYKVT